MSNRKVTRVGRRRFRIRPNSFVTFPAPSITRRLQGPDSRSLICLVKNRGLSVRVTSFPHLKGHVFQRTSTIRVFGLSSVRPFDPL